MRTFPYAMLHKTLGVLDGECFGLRHRIVWQVCKSVSENHAASTFDADLS
jgi:hypothetical protein